MPKFTQSVRNQGYDQSQVLDMYGDWKAHDDNGVPPLLREDDRVVLTMDDATVIGPVKVMDADWCYPDDPIVLYRVKKRSPGRGCA